MKQTLPPVVRVFISSTFADMINERNYFNQVLAPQLTRLCEKRGVSFFSVDLRWGITKEEQINGEVLPICLREIDKCRPFFIGMIGNRYGSTLESVSEELASSFPWLVNYVGKSITELEMLYGVLDATVEKKHTDCAFFFRDEALSMQYYDAKETAEGSKKLKELKQAIRAREDVPHYEYQSLEAFGRQLLTEFERWLDIEFPTVTSVKMARREWYNNELKRDYYEIPAMERFLSNYLKNSRRALLVYGEGKRGKTSLLSNWARKQENTVLINCYADEEFRYWPSIAHEIIKKITRMEPTCGMPEYKAKNTMMYRMVERMRGGNTEDIGIYYVTDEERESFRKGFVQWLQNLQISRQVTIIINDIQGIHDKNSYYLSWLPVELPENVHLICTANADEIKENATNIGWNCMEMPLCEDSFVVDFLDTYMHNYGKNLSANQKEKLYGCTLLQYPGYLKFIMKFLVVYGSFENLDYLTETLGGMQDISKVYQFVLEYMTAGLQEKEVVYNALGFAYDTSIGLKEEECYGLVEQMVAVNALTWSNVRVVLEQFDAVNGEYWKLENRDMKHMIEELAIDRKQINILLGKHFMKLLQSNERMETLKCFRDGTEYAKAAVEQYTLAKDWIGLTQILQSEEILFNLGRVDWKRVRVAWMQVLLCSDIDVESILVLLAKKYVQENKQIAYQLACMLFDLEMYESLNELEVLIGKKVFSEIRYRGNAKYSASFIERYNNLVTFKKRKDYRAVYHGTREWLASGEELRPEELCEIYSLKEESEMILRLYADAIETSGKAYELAIQSMDIESLMGALIARGNCQMQFGNIKEARENFAYVQKLALEEGFLREYLSSKNLEGMCCYREKKYEEAVSAFDGCIRIWKQVKNLQELQSCSMNQLTVFYLKGDKERYLEESKRLYEEIDALKNPAYDRNRLFVLNHVGLAETGLNHSKEAEEIFLQILSECQKNGYDYALESACNNLMKLYKEQNLKVKGIEICEILLEYLFSTRRYHELVATLEKEIEQLKLFKYDTLAEELYAKWEKRFMELPNGRALFEKQDQGRSDEVRMMQIKEEMAVAKSADDKSRQGMLLVEKAKKLESTNPKETTDTYWEAIRCFEEMGDKENCHLCAISAIENLFIREKNYEEVSSERFYPYLMTQDLQIIKFWLKANSLRKERLLEETGATEICSLLVQVSAFREESKLVYPCLYDFLSELILITDEETIVQIMENTKGLKFYSTLVNDICATYEEEYNEGLHQLMNNYAGRNAERQIKFYERCVKFFPHVYKEQAAVIAGNLALIFRRREEKEKTYYYHETSRNLYRELEKDRDSYIEIMNLATAHWEFNDPKKAVEVLQEALKELAETKLFDIRGAVAGNLAKYLTYMNENGEYDDEILVCFGIEENYFKNAGEQRGYVISLVNQIVFYLRKEEKYLDLLVTKYQEAKAIVEQYRIREFMQPLQQIGGTIERLLRKHAAGNGAETVIHEDEIEAQVKAFFAEDEKFELVEMKMNDQVLEVGAKLKEERSGAGTRLMLNISLDRPTEWDVIFLMQPQIVLNPNYDRDIFQYVLWWNLQQEYGLRTDEKHMLYVRKTYYVDQLKKAKAEFVRDAKLWMADLMNMMVLALGAMDMDDVRAEKQKLLEKIGK